jgi:hypothetical protein
MRFSLSSNACQNYGKLENRIQKMLHPDSGVLKNRVGSEKVSEGFVMSALRRILYRQAIYIGQPGRIHPFACRWLRKKFLRGKEVGEAPTVHYAAHGEKTGGKRVGAGTDSRALWF